MNTEPNLLNTLKETLRRAKVSLDQCANAAEGFETFAGNRGGLVFCSVQLQQAAADLREHAAVLATISTGLHVVYAHLPEQLELHDIGGLNGKP